jgi:hypothetical protein
MSEESKNEKEKSLRILILQRGWVMVGYFSEDKKLRECLLEKASVIRRWGTTKGLGEITFDGPTSETVLDPCNGDVKIHPLTIVASISANEENWKEHLK